jgi:hypothetical protein
MSKFVVIYAAPESAEATMENNDPAAAAEGMKAWMDWAGRAGQHLTDMGAPLGNGREISPSGTSDAGAGVGGYSILEADDMDQALALMDGHPHLMMPGASIRVYEALNIPGM